MKVLLSGAHKGDAAVLDSMRTGLTRRSTNQSGVMKSNKPRAARRSVKRSAKPAAKPGK